MAHILIVDDQKSVLLTLESLLVSEKHVVTSCSNAIDAINCLTSEAFDLVITDAIMPVGGTGYALIRTIRGNPALSRLPVILLTGKREKADVEKGIDAGADDYVVKPIDPPLLLAKIRNIIEKKPDSGSHFAEARVQLKAEWDSKTEIVVVSEIGLTLQSNLSVPPGVMIKINSRLFEDIPMPVPMLRIVSCEGMQTPEGLFKIKANFIGLSERELTPLRLWIRSKMSF